jgi:hypothetical protein
MYVSLFPYRVCFFVFGNALGGRNKNDIAKRYIWVLTSAVRTDQLEKVGNNHINNQTLLVRKSSVL